MKPHPPVERGVQLKMKHGPYEALTFTQCKMREQPNNHSKNISLRNLIPDPKSKGFKSTINIFIYLFLIEG